MAKMHGAPGSTRKLKVGPAAALSGPAGGSNSHLALARGLAQFGQAVMGEHQDTTAGHLAGFAEGLATDELKRNVMGSLLAGEDIGQIDTKGLSAEEVQGIAGAATSARKSRTTETAELLKQISTVFDKFPEGSKERIAFMNKFSELPGFEALGELKGEGTKSEQEQELATIEARGDEAESVANIQFNAAKYRADMQFDQKLQQLQFDVLETRLTARSETQKREISEQLSRLRMVAESDDKLASALQQGITSADNVAPQDPNTLEVDVDKYTAELSRILDLRGFTEEAKKIRAGQPVVDSGSNEDEIGAFLPSGDQ